MAIENLKGWEIVDDMSGRRWLCEVVEELSPGSIFPSLKVRNALEMTEAAQSAIAIPEAAPDPLAIAAIGRGGRQPPQQMNLRIEWVHTSQRDFGPPMGLPHLPERTMVVAGRMRVEDYPVECRYILLDLVQQHEKACAQVLTEAKRAQDLEKGRREREKAKGNGHAAKEEPEAEGDVERPKIVLADR